MSWIVYGIDGSIKEHDGSPTLADLQGAVGGLIEVIPSHLAGNPNDDFICNEEGLCLGLQRNPHFAQIAGPVVRVEGGLE